MDAYHLKEYCLKVNVVKIFFAKRTAWGGQYSDRKKRCVKVLLLNKIQYKIKANELEYFISN